MPAPKAESASSYSAMRPFQQGIDPQSPEYVQWQLQENLNIHATNSAKLTKQVKQLQDELSASQYESSQLRQQILTLQQQLEQVQQHNVYYMQGIQTNTENLARITQMEREKALLIKNCDHFKAAMVKAQQAERQWNTWYLQQSSTKATVPMAPSPAFQGEDDLPDWAKGHGAVPAAPSVPYTPVGGVLYPNPPHAAVQSKPKAATPKIPIVQPPLKTGPAKARLPMPKRPLQTNVEDELPSWARAAEPPAAAAVSKANAKPIDKPVLVTKPVAPTAWVDQPEPHTWQRFVNNATSAYSLYRPAPTERLVPMDSDGTSTIGPSPSVAPFENHPTAAMSVDTDGRSTIGPSPVIAKSVVAESLSSWVNVQSQITDPPIETQQSASAAAVTRKSEPSDSADDMHL